MTLRGWVEGCEVYTVSLFCIYFIDVPSKAGHMELCFNTLNQVIILILKTVIKNDEVLLL
jgi:hypothetical protein